MHPAEHIIFVNIFELIVTLNPSRPIRAQCVWHYNDYKLKDTFNCPRTADKLVLYDAMEYLGNIAILNLQNTDHRQATLRGKIL